MKEATSAFDGETIVEVFDDSTVADFHARGLPNDARPRVWHFVPQGSALVLGSTQDETLADVTACSNHAVEIVRRRSGGGAVLLQPGRTIWIDVLLPAGHRLWRTDIGEAGLWLGEVLARALEEHGVDDLDVHRGGLVGSRWSSLICFAGRGPGEVFDSRGSKLVGISQRRTRDWARFQCAVSVRWDPVTFVGLLRPPRPTPDEVADAGSSLLADMGSDVAELGGVLVEAIVRRIDADR